jgi:predicted O-methyltransferase YrrM
MKLNKNLVIVVGLAVFVTGSLVLLMGSEKNEVVIPDTPMMVTQDWQHIDAVMEETKPATFLEWGTGSSTFYFSKHKDEDGAPVKYTSVEHHPGWCGEMKKQLWQRGVTNVDYVCEPVVQGFRGWAGGWSEGSFAQFEEYIQQSDHAVNKYRAEHECSAPCGAFDMVLVDGRARIACALYVLRHLRAGSILFIHDFDRTPYRAHLKQYYNLVWESPSREDREPRLGQWVVKREYVGKELSLEELKVADGDAQMDLDSNTLVLPKQPGWFS